MLIKGKLRNLWFVHIPKTGGLSVCQSFGIQPQGHRPFYRAPDDAISFAFVRDPVARLKSAYRYLKGGGSNAQDAKDGRRFIGKKSFPEFVDAIAADPGKYFEQQHIRPQHLWMPVTPQMLFRFDDFSAIMDCLAIKANGEYPAQPVPHSNQSHGDAESDGPSDQIIWRIYAIDRLIHERALDKFTAASIL